jgi:hypothetical protein
MVGGAELIDCDRYGLHNHWIAIELAGTKGNRLALKARIKANAGELIQMDEVRSGGSYLSQNDLRMHFGLRTQDHLGPPLPGHLGKTKL